MKNLNSGTKLPEATSPRRGRPPGAKSKISLPETLTAKDICAILETSAKSRVRKLEIPGFLIADWNAPETHAQNAAPIESGEPVYLTAEDKELREELRLAQLMTDDPEAYEQTMIDANLGTGENAGEEH